MEFGSGFPFYGGSGHKNVEIKAGIRRGLFSSLSLTPCYSAQLFITGAWSSVNSLSEALDSSSSMQSIQKTTTRRIVDGKVVSETNDTKVLRR